jgi:hypothetical protein
MTTNPDDPTYATATETAPTNGRVVLSRDAILRADDIVTEWVSVREWAPPGATNPEAYGVYVRGMTAGERDALESSMLTNKGQPNTERLAQFRSRLLILSVVDEAGRKVFQAGDVRAVSQKSMAAVERVLDVARRLSGMTEEDVEELTGNSDGQDDESSST